VRRNCEHAELIALWVREHHPWRVALTDVGQRRTKAKQSRNLGIIDDNLLSYKAHSAMLRAAFSACAG
jgi:hypothetical protein